MNKIVNKFLLAGDKFMAEMHLRQPAALGLKAEINKIDVDKLKTVRVNLNKLRNVVNNEVVKKTVYDILVVKADAIDSSGFALKSKYDTDKLDLEKKINGTDKKIPDVSGLVRKQIIMLKLLK